jgi:hypothetical protein
MRKYQTILTTLLLLFYPSAVTIFAISLLVCQIVCRCVPIYCILRTLTNLGLLTFFSASLALMIHLCVSLGKLALCCLSSYLDRFTALFSLWIMVVQISGLAVVGISWIPVCLQLLVSSNEQNLSSFAKSQLQVVQETKNIKASVNTAVIKEDCSPPCPDYNLVALTTSPPMERVGVLKFDGRSSRERYLFFYQVRLADCRKLKHGCLNEHSLSGGRSSKAKKTDMK